MAKERAQRRAQRERELAEAAAVRAAQEARRSRRQAQADALTGWIPRPRKAPSGILAERRRRQVAMTIALLVAINMLTYFFDNSWSVRTLVLLVSLLAAPVVYTMLFRKA